MMILIMLTSTLSGCTTSDEDENIIEIGIISPVEGDCVFCKGRGTT